MADTITTNGSTPLIDNTLDTTIYSGWLSEIQLPNDKKYKIKGVDFDLRTRFNEYLNKQLNTIIAFNGDTATAANIPAGVKVKVGTTETTGTLTASAATTDSIYLVKNQTVANTDVYDEYITIRTSGTSNDATGATFAWEKLGNTQIALTPTKAKLVEATPAITVAVTAANNGDVVTGLGANDTVNAITALGAGTVPAYVQTAEGKALGSSATFSGKLAPATNDKVKVLNNSVTATVPAYQQTGKVNALTDATIFSTTIKDASTKSALTSDVVKSITQNTTSDDATLSYITAQGDVALTGTTTFVTSAIDSATLTTTPQDGQTGVKVATNGIKSVAVSMPADTAYTTLTNNTKTNTDPLKGATVSNECLTFGSFTLAKNTEDVAMTATPTNADTSTYYVATSTAGTDSVGISQDAATLGYAHITTTTTTDHVNVLDASTTFNTTATNATSVITGIEENGTNDVTFTNIGTNGAGVSEVLKTNTIAVDITVTDKDEVTTIGGIETSDTLTNDVTFATHTTDAVLGADTTISKANVTATQAAHTHTASETGTGAEVVTDIA